MGGEDVGEDAHGDLHATEETSGEQGGPRAVETVRALLGGGGVGVLDGVLGVLPVVMVGGAVLGHGPSFPEVSEES